VFQHALPSLHPDYIETQRLLGLAYTQRNASQLDVDRGVPLLEAVRNKRELLLAESLTVYRRQVKAVGDAQKLTGRPILVEEQLKRLLILETEVFGRVSEQVARTHIDLAINYKELGDHSLAESELRSAHSIIENLLARPGSTMVINKDLSIPHEP